MLAFQITHEDVIQSIPEFSVTDKRIFELMGQLDSRAIEKAALYGDEIEAQTIYAHDEIRQQIHRLVGAERMAELMVEQMNQRLNPDMAKNAIDEASTGVLDELVFEHIGTSKEVSNSINNAGFVVQVANLIKIIGYSAVRKSLEEFWEIDIFPLPV